MKRLLPLLFVMSSASAADWVTTGGTTTQTMSVDKNTIVAVGKYRKAWVQSVFTEDRMAGSKPYRSQKALLYYVCPERLGAIVSVTLYQKDGNVSETASVKLAEAPFNEILPDSLNETAFDYVCKAKL